MMTLTTERVHLLGRCRALAYIVSVVTLCALALHVQAATINFPRGTVDVKLNAASILNTHTLGS